MNPKNSIIASLLFNEPIDPVAINDDYEFKALRIDLPKGLIKRLTQSAKKANTSRANYIRNILLEHENRVGGF